MANDTITKIEKTFECESGEQSRLTVYLASRPGGSALVGVYGHHRANDSEPWSLCSENPHPDWKSMSVDEYEKRGRSELLQYIKRSDIFKYSAMLGQPLEAVRDRLGSARVQVSSGLTEVLVENDRGLMHVAQSAQHLPEPGASPRA